VTASRDRPLPAVTLAEVLATSDVPGGVVNLLTGDPAELAPVLAGHLDVDAIDVSGAAPAAAAELERLAAGNLKRVLRARDDRADRDRADRDRGEPDRAGQDRPEEDRPEEDWTAPPGTRRLLAFLETKTVWHPAGS
jgi:hypothetical protein